MPRKTRAQKQITKLRRKLTQQQETSSQRQEIREKKIIKKIDKTKTVTETKESTYSPSLSYSHLTSDLKHTGIVTLLCLALLVSLYLFA